MEETKFLPPKFSFACMDLAQEYNVIEQSTAISTLSKTSSNVSIVSVPGLKESALPPPKSPHSQLGLQTIKEKEENRRYNKRKVISTPKTNVNTAMYNRASGLGFKSSPRKNSVNFSQAKTSIK